MSQRGLSPEHARTAIHQQPRSTPPDVRSNSTDGRKISRVIRRLALAQPRFGRAHLGCALLDFRRFRTSDDADPAQTTADTVDWSLALTMTRVSPHDDSRSSGQIRLPRSPLSFLAAWINRLTSSRIFNSPLVLMSTPIAGDVCAGRASRSHRRHMARTFICFKVNIRAGGQQSLSMERITVTTVRRIIVGVLLEISKQMRRGYDRRCRAQW